MCQRIDVEFWELDLRGIIVVDEPLIMCVCVYFAWFLYKNWRFGLYLDVIYGLDDSFIEFREGEIPDFIL